MRLLSFNVQNMRTLASDGSVRLAGARDEDVAYVATDAAMGLDDQDRRLTASVLKAGKADFIVLEEVCSASSLHLFHDEFLVSPQSDEYTHLGFHRGNDTRSLGFATLARRAPKKIVSHAGATLDLLDIAPQPGCGANEIVFRRDCLEVSINEITLFVCHFKAPYPDATAAWHTRRVEALAVRKIIEQRFDDAARAQWLILGDFNEPDPSETEGESAIAPLQPPFSVDLFERLPVDEQWTYYVRETDRYSRPDGFLASPALAARWASVKPEILRMGMGYEVAAYQGRRLPGVGHTRPHASDHAAIALDLPMAAPSDE